MGMSTYINSQAGFIGSNATGVVLVGPTVGNCPLVIQTNVANAGNVILAYVSATGAFIQASDSNLKDNITKKTNYQE
jgi:hypothetical protein